MKITTQAIRSYYNVGFATERERYLRHAQQGELPAKLKHLAHSLPWPVDMEAPLMHLGNFSTPIETYIKVLSDDNFDPDNIPGGIEPDNVDPLHMGIDIQAMPGTKIRPVESGIVTAFARDHKERMERLANVYVSSKSTNITWIYSHLNFESISDKIKQQGDFYFDKETMIEVDKDDFIGEIGLFELPLDEKVIIPEDVESVYGRVFHHLDLSVFEFDEHGLSAFPERPYLNPLLFLKKLYDF